MSEMTKTPPFQPSHTVLFVALPGVELLDVSGPMAVFDVANRLLKSVGRPAYYQQQVTAPDEHATTAAGLTLVATPFRKARPAKTLIIGGSFEMTGETVAPAHLKHVERLANGSGRKVSICGGAFVLGQLGLLDGRRCTTHWLSLDDLRRRFPRANVETDAIFTDQHPVYTSAGVTSGIDLALHLVEKDLGSKVALQVARLLVVFFNRPGGQSQFSAALLPRTAVDQRLGRLIAQISEQPGARHDVDTLAKRAAMSPRHFARVFTAQVGRSPAAFVEQVRVEAARRQLEVTDHGHARVASDCGFGTEETLRRVFHRVVRVSPAEYRQRFRRAG